MSPTFVGMPTGVPRLKLGLMGALLPLALSGASGCATQHATPPALVEARDAFAHAKNGVALQLDPTDVHEADVALQRAEQAFRDEPDDPSTTDLAIVADRRALIAETQAATVQSQEQARSAKQQSAEMAAAQLQSARGQLGQTQQALGRTQMQLQEERTQSAAQAQQLQETQTKLKAARDTIAKIAAVKDDDRGMVITLQGEVLFKTGKWDLKPAAMAKLDQIATALKGKEQPVLVEGFTDDVGSLDMNLDLSQKRAAAVRDYLVSKGIPQDLVTSEGKGPADPVSDNGSVEGRAQNRRVELIVKPRVK